MGRLYYTIPLIYLYQSDRVDKAQRLKASNNTQCVQHNAVYKAIVSQERYIVASELKDPIWHSSEWQIGSFSYEATICIISASDY